MSAQKPVDVAGAWYLGVQCDALFVIDGAPSPSGTDVPPDWVPGGPQPIVQMPVPKEAEAFVEELVGAHNAELIARRPRDAAVDRLIAADDEYDAAQRDWDHATNHALDELSDGAWGRIAARYEEAIMERIAALAAVRGCQDCAYNPGLCDEHDNGGKPLDGSAREGAA